MNPRALVLPLAAAALAACTYRPVYEGPPRPRAEVARLETVPVLSTWTATGPPEICFESFDGQALPDDCTRIEMVPGPHVLVARALGPGTELGTLVRRELRFEAQAGASYWIVYDASERDLDGILRIEVAKTGEVLADSTTPFAELPFAPLPAAARIGSRSRPTRTRAPTAPRCARSASCRPTRASRPGPGGWSSRPS